MSVLRKVLTLSAAGLTALVVGALTVRETAAQQPMDPRMMPPGGGGGYYQPAGMGGPGGPGGPMEPMADQGGGGEGDDSGECPYCHGEGCQACGGQPSHEKHYHPMDADFVGSFIESPIPLTQVRVRYDRMNNFQNFDRAEYFFPTTVANGGQLPAPETVLNLEEITTTLEVAVTDRFSMFVDLPGRIVESDSAPPTNGGANRDGFGDMRVGGKIAVLANETYFLSGVARVYLPTGDATEALGTGHTSVEAGLVYWSRFWERFTFEAEVKDWVATNSPTVPGVGLFGGNVLQYGLGVGYDIIDTCEHKTQTKVSAVAEFVGWTVLDGFESAGNGVTDARGDTIVNGFFGFRATHGQQSFYGGYGRKLTDDYWYKDMFRLEYSWRY